jgi:drug/metabolite transporter (DMT)-like permease
MSKLSDKFNRLGAGAKFAIIFSVCFALGLIAIPVVLHSDHRIFPDWPDWKFIIFGVIVCAAYAAFLAGCGVLYERFFTKRK